MRFLPCSTLRCQELYHQLYPRSLHNLLPHSHWDTFGLRSKTLCSLWQHYRPNFLNRVRGKEERRREREVCKVSQVRAEKANAFIVCIAGRQHQQQQLPEGA